MEVPETDAIEEHHPHPTHRKEWDLNPAAEAGRGSEESRGEPVCLCVDDGVWVFVCLWEIEMTIVINRKCAHDKPKKTPDPTNIRHKWRGGVL